MSKMTVLMQELVNYCMPTYPKEVIVEIVEYLYSSNCEEIRDIANDICNRYTRQNIDFLKEIYFKYLEN